MRRLAPALLLVLLGTAACNNRVGECNALITVINKAQEDLDGLHGQADAAGIRRFANELDSVSKRLGAVELKLEALRGYRDRYQTLVTDYAKDLRTLADAQDGGDVAKIQETAAHGNGLEKDSLKLIGEINGFCGGK